MKKVTYISVADLKSEELKAKAFERISDGLITYFDIGLWHNFVIQVDLIQSEISRFNANAITSIIGQSILETCLDKDLDIALSTAIKKKANGNVIIEIAIANAYLFAQPKSKDWNVK